MKKLLKRFSRSRSIQTLSQAPTQSRWARFRAWSNSWKRKLFDLDQPRWKVERGASELRVEDVRMRDWLNPLLASKWIFGFASDWMLTRRYAKLAGALPAIGIGGCLLVLTGFSLTMTPSLSSMNMRQVFANAVETGNYRRAEIAIGALLEQSPDSAEYRYQQALVYLQLEKPDEARAGMEQLAR
ncbi:MAG: hypothetical protein AAGG44_18225, partial [Planctomycetota bacterium]